MSFSMPRRLKPSCNSDGFSEMNSLGSWLTCERCACSNERQYFLPWTFFSVPGLMFIGRPFSSIGDTLNSQRSG